MISAPPIRSTHSRMTLRVRAPRPPVSSVVAAGLGAAGGPGAVVPGEIRGATVVGVSDAGSVALTRQAPPGSSSHVGLIAAEQAFGGFGAGTGVLGRRDHPSVVTESEQEPFEPRPFAHREDDAPRAV